MLPDAMQPRKKEEKKWMKGEPNPDDAPLDDPLAEKLRQQRSVAAERRDRLKHSASFPKQAADGAHLLANHIRIANDTLTEILIG